MLTWAAVVALAMSAFASLSDWSSVLVNVAELGGVVALFALVCAAEVFSTPRG
jgi:hypothetical protein